MYFTIFSTIIIVFLLCFFFLRPGSVVTIFGPDELMVTEAQTEIIDSEHQRFVHPRYGFSLVLPMGLKVLRVDEGQSTETIIFEPKDGDTRLEIPRFQMFVTPYLPKAITEERLRKDIPSGNIESITSILIGNDRKIDAAMFKSTVQTLGESREVWFIKNGFLFEVTTPLAHDTWIASILNTLVLP